MNSEAIFEDSGPVWTEDEIGEVDEPVAPLDDDEVQQVERSARGPRLCEGCHRARLYGEERLCFPCGAAERRAKDAAELHARMQAACVKASAELEASPYRCSFGCGAHVMHDGRVCSECEPKKRDADRRDECVRATRFCLPERWKWASFEAPELAQRVRDKHAIGKAIAACAAPIDRLILGGLPGAGKTTLAACVEKRIAHERKLVGRYVTARELMVARSQSSLGEEAKVVREALEADILVIDDLGLDNPQHHGSAVLDVVYSRFAEAKATIVTLSIGIEEIEPRYGGGFGRRLLEPDPSMAYIDVRRLGVIQGGGK